MVEPGKRDKEEYTTINIKSSTKRKFQEGIKLYDETDDDALNRLILFYKLHNKMVVD